MGQQSDSPVGGRNTHSQQMFLNVVAGKSYHQMCGVFGKATKPKEYDPSCRLIDFDKNRTNLMLQVEAWGDNFRVVELRWSTKRTSLFDEGF